MKAVMINDDYSDITIGFPYEIDRIFADGHIKLKNSPRRYMHGAFDLYVDGVKMPYEKAYRFQQLEEAKKKQGMK